MVNFHGEQLYDSYVLPPPKIEVRDYRTCVSGIKPEHLLPGYARPFATVQADVAKLLEGRILVGHALRNDLEVLLLSHPKRDVRDTARYQKWRKQHRGTPALRLLAREVLGLEIQTGEHSSLEDARAAMLLFRKEKTGFEEEVRRRYGQTRVQRVEGAEKKRGGRVDGSLDDDEGDESDDLDVLEGEAPDHFSDANPDTGAEEGPKTAPRTRKKGKKKKRTKRK
jgi:RNA exonuclease 4